MAATRTTPSLFARAAAWAGALLFAAALGYFLFTYAVTFGVRAGGRFRWSDVAFDAALFGLFAVHHSVFARTPLKAAVARAIPAELERPLYVWIASLMLVLVCALWRPIPGVAWEANGAAAWLVRGTMIAGLWLTLRSAAVLDVWDLAGVRRMLPRSRQGAAAPARSGDDRGEIRLEGPYRWVRHPIYLGWFLIVFGVTPMTMTRLVFAVVSCAYVLIAIPLEERTLRATAGDAYERYMRHVRWRLLPGVYAGACWVLAGPS